MLSEKKLKLHLLIITFLFVAEMFALGCQMHPVPSSGRTQPDAAFTRFLEQNLGTNWYGIYLQDSKIGFLKSVFSFEKEPAPPFYRIQLSGTLSVPVQSDAGAMNLHVVAEFLARPPYSLVRYVDRARHKDEMSEIAILKDTRGYLARITRGQETTTNAIGSLDYTLKNYTALQRWIARKPRAGAGIKYPYLDLETLSPVETTARIKTVQTTLAAGAAVTYYDVVTTGPDGLEIQKVYGTDGQAYRMVLGKQFECRPEPPELARNMSKPADLFVKNTVPVNRPLGDAENITLLKLVVDQPPGTSLTDAPGQSVDRSRSEATITVTLRSTGAPHVRATAYEINTNLSASTDIPANHPKIVSLTRSAVGRAKTPAEKVNRLVKFVRDYIDDDYSANPLSTLDIVAKKKGDCSEHTGLFIAMARSAGIPCRTVGGIVYLGDAAQAFGLHAWNEVVLNGLWHPVDPTWGQTAVDATHIRFPLDVTKEWQIMAAIPRMKLKVLHIDYKKQG